MAIVEQNSFNPGVYASYTPKVSYAHNMNVFSSLLLLSLVVIAGLIVYTIVEQKIAKQTHFGT